MFWHPKPLEDVEGHHVHPEESVQEEELKERRNERFFLPLTVFVHLYLEMKHFLLFLY